MLSDVLQVRVSYGSCAHLSQQITVQNLEHFIEAELAEPLHGVADEGGGPALGQSSDPILPDGHSEAVSDAFVFVGVHLGEKRFSH